MKCSNCGADLADDVLFCKECGQKVIKIAKRFCRECGTELDADAKFCKNCGATVNLQNDSPASESNNANKPKTVVVRTAPPVNKETVVKRASAPKKAKEIHTNSSLTSNLNNNNLLKIVIILAAVFLCFVIVISAISKNKKEKTEAANDTAVAPIQSLTSGAEVDYSIDTSYTYAYMSDDWDVYIAVPVSSSVIKIEHWDKTMSSTKKMSYDSDIGTFKLADPENGFYWIDDEHTAFAFNIKDKNNSRISKGKSVVFTINISDTDVCKGTDYDESIACYVYTNDDWHEYRAIPLTDKLIKVEVWSRSSSLDKSLFGYDLFLINPQSGETDFEWGDASHKAFTITTQDPENDYYWKEPSFVAFTLSNPDYKFATVSEYLGLSSGSKTSSAKEEKDGFDSGVNKIVLDGYRIDIPKYWSAEIEENDHYRAYAEKSGKTAMLEISTSYDDEDTVTYDLLAKENENGSMASAIKGWFSSCGEVESKAFDNGNIKGFVYSTDFVLEDNPGHCECLCYPSENNNKWVFVALMQTDNCDYSYVSDFGRVLNTISIDDGTSATESFNSEDTTTTAKADANSSAVSDTFSLTQKDDSAKEETSATDNKKDTEGQKEATTSTDTKSGNEMPIMSGTKLDTVVSTASKYGVSEQFDDDFGHGTRCKAMADSTGGLMMDVIYSSSTNEILAASITTNKLATTKQQNNFIKGMSAVLCPSSDSSDVSKWVSDNVGSKKSTTIGGFTYEVDLGPVDNALYWAGNKEWEDWESQYW